MESKYEALLEILRTPHERFKIKSLAFWGCSLTSQKLVEILTLAQENHKIHSLELSDITLPLKKSVLGALASLFKSMNPKSKQQSLLL